MYFLKLKIQRKYYCRTGYAFETVARHDNFQGSVPRELLNTSVNKPLDYSQFIMSEENSNFECLANESHIENAKIWLNIIKNYRF